MVAPSPYAVDPRYTEPYPEEIPPEQVVQPAPTPAPAVAPSPYAVDPRYEAQAPVEQTPAATPLEAVPAPGLGGVPATPAYTAQPPPEQAPPPAPGGPLSGVGDVLGRVADTAGAVGSALLAGDPGRAAEEVLGMAAAPQAEYEVPRLTERAEEQRPLAGGEILADPAVAADILPAISAMPNTATRGILPEGAPGVLNEPFNVLGGAISQVPIFAANIVGTPYDVWMAENPHLVEAARAQGGDLGVYEAWKASGGVVSAPPPQLSNPIDAGKGAGNILASAAQVAGAVPEMLGGYKDAFQSGSLTPFAKSMAVDLTTDPLLAAQVALGLVSGGAGAAAKLPVVARNPVLRTAAGAVSRGAGITNRALDVAQGDPTSAAALARDVIRTPGNLAGAIRPTDEGLTQLQANQIMETTGTYQNVRQAAAAPAPVSPARVTPGAPLTPVMPNGRPVSPPDLAQPVTRPGAPAPLVDSRGRRVDGVPEGPPPQIVSPSTGQPLVTRAAADPALEPVRARLRQTLDDRHMQDVAVQILDAADIARKAGRTPEEFRAAGQDIPAGAYFPEERLIAIAADAAHSGQAPFFLDHESIHALRQSQLFREAEWRTLQDAAERAPGLREEVQRLYGDLETTNPEQFAEEMVAALYTAVRHGGLEVTPQVRTLLQKLMDFLKGLGRGVNDSLPAEVLARIDNGEIGKRARQASEQQSRVAFTRREGEAPGYVTMADFSSERVANREALTAMLRGHLDAMGLQDVGVEVRPNMGWLRGEYDPYAKMVSIAETIGDTGFASADEALFRSTLDHEAVHAFRDLGLMTQQEFDILLREANATDVAERTRERTRNRYREDYTNDEIVADLFAEWRMGRTLSGEAASVLSSIMRRVEELVRRVRDSIYGPQAESILETMASGEMGNRARRARINEPGRKPMAWPPNWQSDYTGALPPEFREGLEALGIDPDQKVAFALRKANAAPQRMRDAVQTDAPARDAGEKPIRGIAIGENAPDFLPRFRAHLATLSTPEQLADLSRPFLESPDLAPTLMQATGGKWNTQSRTRLQQAIEWAHRTYDYDPKTGKLKKNKQGLTPTQVALAKAPDLAAPSAAVYDKMLRMPRGHHLWYDLSGVGFDELAEWGMPAEDVRQLIDFVAATSGNEAPLNNSRLALALKSLADRDEAAWVGLRDEVATERIMQGVGHGTFKYDNFSRNLAAQTAATREMDGPEVLPTIDVWQFRAYGVDPNKGAANPILYGIVARHTVQEAQAIQRALGEHFSTIGDQKLSMEHRFMQAGVWVLGRENEARGGFAAHPRDLEIPGFEKRSDYQDALRRIMAEQGGQIITPERMVDPDFANDLTRGGVSNYEQRPHGLVEFASSNTLPGVERSLIWHNLNRLPDTEANRKLTDKILNGYSPSAVEKEMGRESKISGLAKSEQMALQKLAQSKALDRMMAAILGEGYEDFAFSRLNFQSWGTWGDELNPQIDIPSMGRAGNKRVYIPQAAMERLVYGLSQAMRQDGAAWNQWKIHDLEPGEANAVIMNLPDFHLEDARTGGRKVIPQSLARVREVMAPTGWSAQVVASPRVTQIKFINTGGGPLDTALLDAALDEAGYKGRRSLVPARHDSHFIEADAEIGYGRFIQDPRAAHPEPNPGGLVAKVRMARPRGVGEADWTGGSPESFRTAVQDARKLMDAHLGELSDTNVWHANRVRDALAANGLEWEVPEHLAQARDRLWGQPGGAAPNFPLDETAFARRPRTPSASFTALGHIAGRARAQMLANTDPSARLGYHGYVLDPTTDQLLRHPLDVHWRDGSRARGVEFGDLIEQTGEKLERFIQLERDPALRAAHQTEYDRLQRTFVPEEGSTVDFAALGGPGDPTKQQWQKNRVVGEAISDAVERGLPKNAKGSSAGLMGQLGGALDSYSRVRGMFGLFAVWNVPKYFTQNWVGNGIMTALKKPSALPPYLMRLRDVRQTAKEVSGKRYSSYDARLAKMKVAAIPTVDLVDKAQIGGRRGNLLPEQTGLARLARPFMSEKLTAYAQTGDYAQRQAVAEDVIDSGYAILNRNLARIALEDLRRAGSGGSRTPLPYTETQIRQAVAEFQNERRSMIDLNTGQPYKDKLGRIAKFEPIYSAEEFRDGMRTKLLAVNNRVDTTVLNDALHRLWSDVELAKRSTVDTVKREVEDVAYSWVPTNVSEAARKVVMYPYWTTKAGMAYARYMLSHPAAAATYGRMMEEMEERSEELGLPDWMKSFFRVMNTPLGMEVWYNPADLITTFLTFPDWAMEAGHNDWDDLSALGEKVTDIPFLVNPMLSLAIYATGAGGPDFKAPDVLGVNKGTTLASSILNMANAHGLLPDWIGKDATGEIVPINPRPLEELTARVGHALSSALQSATGWEPVPVPNVGGSAARDVTYWIEQNVRRANPEMDQEMVNAQVTRIMGDHESPEYREALSMMASQALTLGGGLDLPLTPEGFDRALEAVLRISSPVGITAGPEQLWLDSRAEGMTPSGEVPPRVIPHLGEVGPDGRPTAAAEDAERTLDDAKYGASATLASRAFKEEISGYYDGRNADGLGEINSTFWGIYLNKEGEDPSSTVPEPVVVDGVEWTPEEIAGLDRDTRNTLAKAYAAQNGTSMDALLARRDTISAFEQQYYTDHPLVGSYINDFRNPARDYPGGELAYVGALMSVNPAYADYIYTDGLKDGQINLGAALSSDAFLASQGIAPSNYTPLSQPPLIGPGREPPPYQPPVADVTPLEPLNLRAGPGTQYAAEMTIAPGTPLKAGATQGEWTAVGVPGQEPLGWVATAYLGTLDGASDTAPGATPAPGNGVGDMLGGALGSLLDTLGGIVGTMWGAPGQESKPAITSVGKPYAAYDVVMANDGLGVQSTRDGSDRTWMEDMIGPGHAIVTSEYKGPEPSTCMGCYGYQDGHGAATNNHAAYDISCDTGNCVGTPMYAPMAGRVVCSGYGDGTGQAVGSPACTYSQQTTLPGQAHTIVIEVGTDKNGNPIQLSFNHMGTSTLKPGQTIKQGDLIGTMGDTDAGPHVHLEGWIGDRASGYQIVDPQLIVGGYYFAAPVAAPLLATA